jgi:mannonate dehydratase
MSSAPIARAEMPEILLAKDPARDRAIEDICTMIRRAGQAGIPMVKYNLTFIGVVRTERTIGRGGASLSTFDFAKGKQEPPLTEAGRITEQIYWDRIEYFLKRVVPVAEEAGVILAAHPDDPPTPTVRNQPRLVNQPALYQKLIDRKPSRSNALEFCLGTLAEMTDGDLYEAVESYSSQHKIAYIHFRNVRGKAPHYWETFIDEGDIDMLRVLRILRKNGYEGVLIPDHAPAMTCSAPWYAGMAYACGWMKAAIHSLDANG